MDTLDALDEIELLSSFNIKKTAKKKKYRKRKNPFLMYDDDEFRKRYRFSKENARKLILLVKPDLKGKKKGGRVPVYLQVLSALRCWGRNQVQEDCADTHGFSQPTMSRVSEKVGRAFAKKARQFIKMPDSAQEQVNTMRDFEKLGGFKKVIGAIDCTHLRIQAVGGDDAQLYVNRKSYFSYNVQAVCDSSLKITDIVACWKGRTHDSRIFNNSKIKEKFESGNFMGRLVGDGGYKCTNYMFTPVNNPRNSKEEAYNKAQIKTRNVIERLFGVWKSRFRILLNKMRLSRKNAKTLIVALAVLHNLAILFKEENFECHEDNLATPQSNNEDIQDEFESTITRAVFIQRYF